MGLVAAAGVAALAGCDGPEPEHCLRRGTFLVCAPDTPEQALGREIFDDTGVSEPAGQACASCHQESAAFTGNHGSQVPAVGVGSRAGVLGNRNPPTAAYASFSPPFAFRPELDGAGRVQMIPSGGQFWGGRAADLVEQAKGPFLNPREMANPDRQAVVAKLRRASYAPMFEAAYGPGALDDTDAAYGRMARAVAASERVSRKPAWPERIANPASFMVAATVKPAGVAARSQA